MNQPESNIPSTSAVSGKLVILGIFGVALLAAGASWWFRYNATHHAAGFWGSKVARLIRDASHVKLQQITRDKDGTDSVKVSRFVSKAPGLTHLRAALLEDSSFEWPATDTEPPSPSGWYLRFEGDSAKDVARLYFTPDLRYVFHFTPELIHSAQGVSAGKFRGISCAPISAGLLEMFTEMMAGPAAAGPPPQSPAPSPSR
jgi:hypothetical protein